MTVRIDGTNSTANPAITGADTDTGLQLGTDEIQFVTGGTNRVTVESDGNLTIEDGNLVLAENHGIDFHDYGTGATIDSNLLDDYEEGTWTPTVAGGTTAGTYETHGALGWYTKVGRLVHASFRVDLHDSAVTGGGSGNLTITGFPFTPQSGGNFSNNNGINNICYMFGMTISETFAVSLMTTGTSAIVISLDSTGNQTIEQIGIVGAADTIASNLTYFTAA